jgi:hypothetical protein
MAKEKDSDDACGDNTDGEAMAEEKASDAPLGAAMDQAKDSDAPVADTMGARDRLRLRRRSTGGRTGIAINQRLDEATRTRRIRKNAPQQGVVSGS